MDRLCRSSALLPFIAYRILCGVGVSIASVLSPLYIAEIAPPDIRGRLIAFNQLAIVLGMLLVYFVNWSIASAGDDVWLKTTGWLLMLASEAVPALLFLFLLLLVPDTPRLLVMNVVSKKPRWCCAVSPAPTKQPLRFVRMNSLCRERDMSPFLGIDIGTPGVKQSASRLPSCCGSRNMNRTSLTDETRAAAEGLCPPQAHRRESHRHVGCFRHSMARRRRSDWSDRMLAATDLDRSQMPSLMEGNSSSAALTRKIAEQ